MSRSKKSASAASRPSKVAPASTPAAVEPPAPSTATQTPENTTPLLDEAEHTLFVNGTWSGTDGDYWDDGVEGKANELLGSQTGEEFDWYGGPNDKRARRLAGRRLLRDGVTPAFERDEVVNLVSHSHGGNVVGEMTAALDARLDYLGALEEGLSAPVGSPEHTRAVTALEERLASLEAERESITSIELQKNELNLDGKFDPERSKAEMFAQLDEEIAETMSHHATLMGGGSGLDILEERRVLEDGEFGDAILINTPYLEDHANALDSDKFASSVDNIYDFNNDLDGVVLGAQSHQCSEDERLNAMTPVDGPADCIVPEKPTLTNGREETPNASKVTTTTWERKQSESISMMDDYEQYLKQDHNLPVINGDVFDRVVKGAVEGQRTQQK